MAKQFKHIDTKVIHSGEPAPRIFGAVSIPIFQSATYETLGGEDYHDIKYIRLNNTPNHIALNEKLAALENAEAAIVTASGMAAISTAFLSVLGAGDHILLQNNLYGGTDDLIEKDLPKLNITHDYFDPADPNSWESKLTPNTKAIYVESISNPLMGVGDLKSIVEFARAHKLVSMIDNTFASPVNFRPAEIGFDLSLHSCTKYLNGHNDIVAGAAIGKADLVEKVKHKLDHLGGTLDPHTCYLLHRGLKTLALRVRKQNDNALEISQALEKHGSIDKVNYPGLASHPGHAIARELFDGFGGMVSFEVSGGLNAVDKFFRTVEIPRVAVSLGGVESLLTRPAATSHVGMSPQARERAGITDSLVRLSVGIEAGEDLIADIDRALTA